MNDHHPFGRRQVLSGIAASIVGAGLNTPALGASLVATRRERSARDRPEMARRLSAAWEYLQGSMGGVWEVWHGEDTASWQPVQLPHSFNAYDACDPDRRYYQGNGWYRTRLHVGNPYPDGRTLLHFEGAGQSTTVYVGDTEVGKHVGGYDEFAFDITAAVKAVRISPSNQSHGDTGSVNTSPVPIAILCDNSRDLERIPSDLSDFSLYGGLYRHVNLVYVPAVSFEHIHVITHLASPAAAAEVSVRANFYNPEGSTAAIRVEIEVRDPTDRVLYRSTTSRDPSTEAVQLASFRIAKPMLWSPGSPQLYRCIVTISGSGGEQIVEEKFGLKHTELVEQGPFKLNGKRLLLRGTHRHDDHAGFANAMPDELIDEEMHLIKAMGVNFIRLGHYQQSRRVLDLCDRLGILVWEEIPWCRSGVGGDAFKNMARRMLRNMIVQHFNHPSIVFWGLGNEDDWPTEYPRVDEEDIRAFMSNLNELAHQLDPSRYTAFRRCDFARDIPDVYSPSIWAGWYRGSYTEYQQALETERMRVKHLIHIEWGADSHAGRHSETPDRVLDNVTQGKGTDERGLDYLPTGGDARASRDGDWSETYACNLFDWHLKVQETLPWFVGSAQWVFKDFTTPLRVENPVPRVNQKGLVQRDMSRKEAYYVFQSYWADEPMAHIYGHTWPTRWGKAGEAKLVKVYSNCDRAELFVNGVSAGVKVRDSQDFPAAGLRWTTTFAAGRNELHVVARRGAATVEDTIAFFYETKEWGAPAALHLQEIGRTLDGSDQIVSVEARLLDANGNLCLDAKQFVRFSLAGPGKLIDNLGTSHGSRLVQLYNGRAIIPVLPRRGENAVAAFIENYKSVTINIA